MNVYDSPFLDSLGWTLVDSVWKFGSLWAGYQLLTGGGRWLSATKKYRVAVCALLAGFGWTILGFISHFNGGANNPLLQHWFDSARAAFGILDPLLPFTSLIYLIALTFFILRLALRYLHFSSELRENVQAPGEDVLRIATSLAARFGIKRTIYLNLSEKVGSAMTYGLFKTFIVLPLASINHLTTEEIYSILAHEMVHIRRKDYVVNLLIGVCRLVLFYNPFVHSFYRVIEDEREKICDDTVLSLGIDPWNYANALYTLSRHYRTTQDFAMLATGGKAVLLNRIKRILHAGSPTGVSPAITARIRTVALFFLCLSGYIFLGRPATRLETTSTSGTEVAVVIPVASVVKPATPRRVSYESTTTITTVLEPKTSRGIRLRHKASSHAVVVTVREETDVPRPPAPPQTPTEDEAVIEPVASFASITESVGAFTYIIGKNSLAPVVLDQLDGQVPYVPTASFYYSQIDDSLSASGKTVTHL